MPPADIAELMREIADEARRKGDARIDVKAPRPG